MLIKEVQKLLGISSYAIRYYEKIGLISPQRGDNDYRHYSPEDIKNLKRIIFLRDLDIPIEMIQRILNDPDEFQVILEGHISTLQGQIETMVEIKDKCLQLNKKHIPLLDAVIDGNVLEPHETKEINSLFSKAIHFLQPYDVTTIGRKTTPYTLLKKWFMCFIFCLLPTTILFINLTYMELISENSFVFIFPIAFVCAIIINIILFSEYYFEFTESTFKIFNSEHRKLKSIMALMKCKTDDLAIEYPYKDIKHMQIIVAKKTGGIGYGVEEYFNIIYKFYMLDGQTYEINSSRYRSSDQDRKLVYEILRYHNVAIIDKYNVGEAMINSDVPIFEYLKSVINN